MHQKVLVIGEEPEQQVKGAGLGDYREWRVPARLLNERASVRLLTEGELDDIPGCFSR
jgi:hypothetical protein